MQVEDGLPGVPADVEKDTVAGIRDPLGRGDLVRGLEHLDHDVTVRLLEITNIADVTFGNYQDMNGRSRRDVAEREDVVAIEDGRARDLPRDDLAEETIVGHAQSVRQAN